MNQKMSSLPVQRRGSLYYATAAGVSDRSPVFHLSFSIWSSLKQLLRRPLAFPLLLVAFLFLTWVFLKLQSSSSSSPASTPYSLLNDAVDDDENNRKAANLVLFSRGSPIVEKDQRGWLLNPVSLAMDSGLKGGAVSCASMHAGEIRPGFFRGNHRHHDTNETFVVWGAKTLFRLENHEVAERGYAQVVIGADEVAVACSPSGTAHLIYNVDAEQSTFFVACQDSIISYNSSSTDFNVWQVM